MIYFLVDLEITPSTLAPDGMPEAFLRDDAGAIRYFRELSAAQDACKVENDGIDLGEPGIMILEHNLKTDAQRLRSFGGAK